MRGGVLYLVMGGLVLEKRRMEGGMAYRVATIRLGVGLLMRIRSLLSRVLSYAVRKDGIEGARCCYLVVGHQSWRPAEVSYISTRKYGSTYLQRCSGQHEFGRQKAKVQITSTRPLSFFEWLCEIRRQVGFPLI
jgi:hypothetical protein